MKKRALITGITGQDGAYLAKFLLDKGYNVFGTYRRLSTPNFWRLKYLNIEDKINFIPADLSDQSSIIEAIKQSEPSELYNLAAQSYVGASFDQPIISGEITGIAVTKILESIRIINTKIKKGNAVIRETTKDFKHKLNIERILNFILLGFVI